jgi:NAD(P)-dependent dehydrogenase (short-subunit alcohol dehydrogenase family)
MSAAKVALVTGGGRGIGRAIVLALAEKGWQVAVNYRGNSEAAETTAAEARQHGIEALVIQADIGDSADRTRLVDEVIAHFGRLDLLVNNAGMAPRQRLDVLETTEASYDDVMDVNLKGPFFLTQYVARKFIDLQAAGTINAPKIVNIGSISAYTSSPTRGEYCISKAGMGMMTALFADRLADEGINVYEVRPGIIATDMTSGVTEKYDRLIADGLTPIKRWGQGDDVARAVVALAEDYLPFSTGEIINVDGGFHLRRL